MPRISAAWAAVVKAWFLTSETRACTTASSTGRVARACRASERTLKRGERRRESTSSMDRLEGGSGRARRVSLSPRRGAGAGAQGVQQRPAHQRADAARHPEGHIIDHPQVESLLAADGGQEVGL